MKSWILFFAITVCFSLFSSCKKESAESKFNKIAQDWISKNVVFPEDISCYIKGKDTSINNCADLLKKEYKILLYVDSTGCSACRLRLMQ
jgi:hypothetical protein